MIEWFNLGYGVLAFIIVCLVIETLTRPDALDAIRERYKEKPKLIPSPSLVSITETDVFKIQETPMDNVTWVMMFLAGFAVMLGFIGLFLAVLPPC